MKTFYRGLRAYRQDGPFSDGIEFIYCDASGQKQGVGQPIVISETQQGARVTPTFSLPDDQVQELFNQLWSLGFRPKDGTGNSGHIEALNHHLQDMRKLVFDDRETITVNREADK